jgi:hypothetical protein
MRKMQIVLSFLSLALTASYIQAQSESLSAIQQALTAKFGLTRTTADKTALVKTGSVLVLKKDNLVTSVVSSTLTLSNTYKGGKIAQGLLGHIASGTTGTRTFVTGEKLWVTDIQVASKGIVFTLVSDSYSDQRYRTTLSFPFAKNAVPSSTEAMAMVDEVFETERSGNEMAGEKPASAGQQLSNSEANAEGPIASPAPADSTPWDSHYGRLTSGDIQRIDEATVRFDIEYLRLTPAALDQKPVMQYFIALNNCNDSKVERAIFNELDYPELAAFYKSKASQILAPLPRTLPGVGLYQHIGGHQADGWTMWSASISLGEYNRQQKAFPLKYPGKDSVEIPESLSAQSNVRNLERTCPSAVKAAAAVTRYLPANYGIALHPASYRELPMDEDAARKYIDSAGQQRNVFLVLDVTLLDSPPTISQINNSIAKATFRARIARIKVMDSLTRKPVGTLYDDHSEPAEIQVAQAPPPAPAPAKPANQWAAGDHMYEISQAVYVSLAVSACDWPLTAEQSTNLKKFLDRVSNGNFNEKYQYNTSDARIRHAITSMGRHNYCADANERRSFEKAAAAVAPLGPIAAPNAK